MPSYNNSIYNCKSSSVSVGIAIRNCMRITARLHCSFNNKDNINKNSVRSYRTTPPISRSQPTPILMRKSGCSRPNATSCPEGCTQRTSYPILPSIGGCCRDASCCRVYEINVLRQELARVSPTAMVLSPQGLPPGVVVNPQPGSRSASNSVINPHMQPATPVSGEFTDGTRPFTPGSLPKSAPPNAVHYVYPPQHKVGQNVPCISMNSIEFTEHSSKDHLASALCSRLTRNIVVLYRPWCPSMQQLCRLPSHNNGDHPLRRN